MTSIVLYGPTLAGKSTLLLSLAGQFGGRAVSSTRELDGVPVRALHARIALDRGDVQLATYPGAVWSPAMWPSLFAGASAALIVLDSQPARNEANRACLTRLDEVGAPAKGAVVFTKADIAGMRGVAAAHTALAGTRVATWPSFLVTKGEPAEALRTLTAALGDG